MAKQLNIDLNFNANTEKAKQAILDLQKSLSDIAKMPGQASGLLFDDKDIKKASQSALELQRHLEKAVNVKTGKLDLSRFSISLKAAGKDLNKYYDNLLKIGPAGQKAFLQMANAVATAETPVVRMGKKLEEMGTVLKNTVRWQISSSILHGFMGSVQSALGYAKNLNESLNNIRIVTGQSADEMSKFAIEANRAAKELSTTTNEYAKASLIYYQQGLSDSDVKARTDITIKMANVARESAETVSDQMTAVWNNFYDGSESLESFADKMTALGAETASSTSEISEGLNKFAGIADTVGLSFDYASAALATVTATSRQSADIVGTAFKTMFARIQGLKLGDTLEDGTTLNKYSEALMKVGVNIKDQGGELKDMDTILSEMASKWQTLEKDQQVALAQTVAGTRQYTQLVTLMDNWDFMEKNLETVEESNGALAEQQKIYEEGWEAASDRVRAAAESIYNDLLDDDFFVTILNGFSDVLDAVHGVTEGLGGMKGVAALVGSIFLNLYSKKMPKAMENLRANFMVFTGQSGELMREVQEKTNHKLETIQKDPHESDSIKVQSKGIEQVSNMQQKLLLTSKNLTEQEKEDYKAKIDNVKAMYEEAAALAKVKEEKDKNFEKTKKSLTKSGTSAIKDTILSYNVAKEESDNIEKKLDKATSGKGSDMDSEQFNAYSRAYDEQRTLVGNLEVELNRLGEAYGLNSKEIQALTQDGEENSNVWKKISDAVNKTADSFAKQVTQVAVLDDTSAALNSQAESWAKMTEEAENGLKMTDEEAQDLKETMLNYLKVIEDIDKNNDLKLFEGEDAKNLEDIKASIKDMPTEEIQNATKQMKEFASSFSDKAYEKMKNIDDELDKLRIQLKKMDFSDDDIKKLEEGAGDSAEAVRRLQVALQNANGAAAEVPKSTFAISEAFSELSSTLMATYSLITTVKSAFETFGDESATSLEKFGAAMSLVMSATSAFSSITQFATSLTKNETIAKRALGKANQAAALSAKELAAATKMLSIKIAIILAAITAVVAIAKVLIVTQKEANQSINEATEAYEQEKEKLAELNDELQTTQDRIQQLQNKGSLSIIEEKELTKLKQAESSLEAQLTIQERLTKEKQKTEAREINNNWKKASKLTDLPNINTTRTMGIEIDASSLRDGEKELTGEQYTLDEYKKLVGYETTKEWGASHPEELEMIQGWEESNEQLITDWINENRDQIDANETNYANLVEAVQSGAITAQEANLEDKKATLENSRRVLFGEEYDDKVLGSAVKNMEGSLSTANFEQNSGWGKALGQDTLDALGIQKDAFDDYVSNAIDKAKDAGITTEQLAKLDGKALQILVQNSEELTNYNGGDLLQFLTGYGYEIPSITTKASELREELEKINKISKDMSVGKIISQDDYSTLVNYNAELEKYFTMLADGSVMFTGDKLDFQQELKQTKQNDLLALKDETGNQIQEIENNLNENISGPEWTQEEFAQHTGNSDKESYQSYSDDIIEKQLNNRQEQINQLQDLNATYQSVQNEIALSAEDASERQELLSSGKINEEAFNVAALAAKNAEKWEDVDAGAVEDYADSLMNAAKNSELLSDELKTNEEAAEDVALYTKKMNKGIDSLSKGFKNWNSILTKSDKASEEYSDAMAGIKHSMSDVLGVQEDFLSDDFILQNMEDIEKAASGDAEAIDRLAIAASRDILVNIGYQDNGIKEKVLGLHDELTALIPDIEVGATLSGDSEFMQKAQEIIEAAHMTADQANAYFGAMGFETNFVTEPQQTKQRVPITVTETTIDGYTSGTAKGPDGEERYWEQPILRTHTYNDGYSEETGEVDAIAMATSPDGSKVPQIKSFTRKSSGAMNNHSSSNKGGKKSGGSKSKPKKTENKAKRYKEVTDSLEDVRRETEKLSKEEDRLYGADKLKKMDEVNKSLEKEVGLLKEKARQNALYLAQDKSNLNKAAADLGLTVDYDENGNISNYSDITNTAFKDLEALENSGASEETIETKKEAYENLFKQIDKYDDSNELRKSLQEEEQDKINEWQDNNYEKLHYEIELDMKVNDMELDELDHYLKKFEGDVYKRAESLALMVGGTTENSSNKTNSIIASLEVQQKEADELNAKLASHEISQEKYVEGMEEVHEETFKLTDDLIALDKEMTHYYGDTLDMAKDELEKYFDMLEHGTKILEHYQDILGLVGASTNYKAIGAVLEGKQKTLKNSMNEAIQEYNEAEKRSVERQMAYEADPSDINKKAWEDAKRYANEAQDQMLASTKQYIENSNALLENGVNEAQEYLEKKMSDGTSFEHMNTQLERAHSLQENYLTKTNQIYETNKLIRKAQNDLDKASNKLAKERLSNFINETKMLQKKEKLSKFELELQQKQYDLELAKIALEEAQNTTSKVRLSKDSEGNYSYVYTADEEATEDAQQNVDDKANDLYNFRLENANKFSDEYAQLKQEYFDAKTQLDKAYYIDRTMTKEEYDQKSLENKSYFEEQLTARKELYYLALQEKAGYDSDYTNSLQRQTDIRDGLWQGTQDMMIEANETWSRTSSGIAQSSEAWSEMMCEYVGSVQKIFSDWEKDMDENVEPQINIDLTSLGKGCDFLNDNMGNLNEGIQNNKDGFNDLNDAIGNVTSESDILKEKIDKEVNPKIQEQIDKVGELTTHYSNNQKAIQNVINEAEKLAKKAKDDIVFQIKYEQEHPKIPDFEISPIHVPIIYDSKGGSNVTGGASGDNNISPGKKASELSQKDFAEWNNGKKAIYNSYGSGIKSNTERDEELVDWAKQFGLSRSEAFNTGGYTGEWGPEGKFAVLHEKEIVLNKEDTSNLLQSVELTNRIIDVLSSNVRLANMGLNNFTPGSISAGSQELNQNVHITADFPNVTDHNEIEEAFNNLLNEASQFANKNL